MPCSSAMTSQNLAPIWFPHWPFHWRSPHTRACDVLYGLHVKQNKCLQLKCSNFENWTQCTVVSVVNTGPNRGCERRSKSNDSWWPITPLQTRCGLPARERAHAWLLFLFSKKGTIARCERRAWGLKQQSQVERDKTSKVPEVSAILGIK